MWVEVTEDDLKEVLSGTELASYRAVALASGQSDPIAGTISRTVNRVRDYIAANGSNQLEEGEKIPDGLLQAALDLLAVEIMKRAAGRIQDPENVRRDAAIEARRLLERVAEGKHPVEQPTIIEDEVMQTPSPTITTRQTDWTTQDKWRQSNQDGI